MNPEFHATLAFLKVIIDQDLGGQTVVMPGYLSEIVTRYGPRINIPELEIDKYVRHLETIYRTYQADGHVLKQNFTEWYSQEKSRIDFHYWRRLEIFWQEKLILPRPVIRSVDTVTDEIMRFLGNPRDKHSWNRRRGLVMGHVQMGKTTNYSALIAKAADAGYQIIVVLAGTTNALRYQTQVRLDKTFVGRSSIGDATHIRIYDVAKDLHREKKARFPYCGTTQLSDFNAVTAKTTGASEGNFADPILFVTKKNTKVLTELTEWLIRLNPGEKLKGPMLLIDDEADNASINTNVDGNVVTAINACIRKLLHTTAQSTYIGYTATPFANIFIDPESTDEWDREDLFPADFIKSLDPPTNYVGAKRLFAVDGDLNKECVIPIADDYSTYLPLKHNSRHVVTRLPTSLMDAVRAYVIFRAIRIAENHATDHSAMLINVSRFNAVQNQVNDHIENLLSEMKKGIESWSRTEWQNSDIMKELHKVWEQEFQRIEPKRFDWDIIRPHLLDSIMSIAPKLVNMQGSNIDYEAAPPTGLHIIAIGGLALARGLTLEGLAISYVLRNVGAADTLLQMGRWFGYRPYFEKLCRVYATQDLIADFAEVSESVEELRTDFARMALLGKTPFDFGLKVRQSETGIAITAKNKMRTATPVLLAEDFSSRHVQAHTLYDSNLVNANNLLQIDKFVKDLTKNYPENRILDKTSNALAWRSLPGRLVLNLIKNLEFPQTEFNELESEGDGSSLVGSYIDDRLNADLSLWDVALPFLKEETKGIAFPFEARQSKNVFCRVRASASRVNKDVIKVNEKNAVAFGTADFSFGETQDEYDARASELALTYPDASAAWIKSTARTRPLLLIHLLNLKFSAAKSVTEVPLNFDHNKPVVSVSIVFPGTTVVCKVRKYHASVRLIEFLAQLREESNSDEEVSHE